jgi:hypothetical protein
MQSAISMMEGGRWSALARPTVEKIAAILGVALPELRDGMTERAVAVASHYCPNTACPTNLPYRVGDEIFLLPRVLPGCGRYCSLCGEVLASGCSGCGASMVAGTAFCGACGHPWVLPPEEALPDPEGWVAERQRQAHLVANWTAHDGLTHNHR